MYQHIDAAFLRAVAHPEGLRLPSWPDLTGDTRTDTDRWRDWLAQVWSQEGIAEAIEVASPVLARRVPAILDGSEADVGRVRRAGLSMIRYLLRLRYRATPFGLFAGVAPARFGSRPQVRWGEEHQVTARADAVWLTDIVTRLEGSPELLHRLPVVLDNTSVVRGGKLVVPCQQPSHDCRGGPAEVSVRLNRAVARVVSAARTPVVAGDLVGVLAAEYPAVPVRVIGGLLMELTSRRILLTALRPPMTSRDALGHVVERLAAVGAEEIPAVAGPARRLREIHRELSRHHTAAVGTKSADRAAVVARMKALSSVTEQPLAVDLRLDSGLVLPREVGAEAERAATALTRLTPWPSGSPAWRDYHVRFLERYGTGTVVPVAELTDPDVGLGYPAGYLAAVRPWPDPLLTTRDERLAALAQQAALDGAREVVLADDDLAELAASDTVRPPAHIELCFHVEAPGFRQLTEGAFRLVVSGAYPSAGALGGRFLDLLEPAETERMAAVYATVPTLESGALPVQVSCPPQLVRSENIGRVPAVLPEVLFLAEHGHQGDASSLSKPPWSVWSPAQLGVRGDPDRLSLICLESGLAVEPAAFHAVEPTKFTHPLARFLTEIPRARASVPTTFTWGAARRMPFLPRLRHGRSVLTPARWRLTAGDLAPAGASSQRWAESLAARCERLRIPDAVLLGDDDRLLRLDLTRSAHLGVLREELEREGKVVLHEAPSAEAYGWLGGRSHEISLALVSRQAHLQGSKKGTADVGAPGSVLAGRDHGLLPGVSPWAFVKLYGHPGRQNEILSDWLPRLREGWDDPPEWWFVRYRDPESHLRLRFRAADDDPSLGRLVRRVGAWAAQMRAHGLLGQVQWDTYHPETGRYGGHRAMPAAEAVFVADSEAAHAQLALVASGGAHPLALTAASSVDLVCAFAGGPEQGVRRLARPDLRAPGPPPARDIRAATMRLATPWDGFSDLCGTPPGREVARAWEERRRALAAYRKTLTVGSAAERDRILAALLHMHHNRAVGIDEGAERMVLRLARAVALRRIADRSPDGD
ncbi:lantibiotic dehydratase [Streptomyces sp. HMX87]|uniref:lantibiotic dehydratase n=1 Tax=Streptomyces sp. HMX87 TaxID=3390849 RepID=UPI003A8C1999